MATGKASGQPTKHESIGVTSVLAPSGTDILGDTSRTLYASLKTLTERLNALASSPLTDPSAIGATAEAITKVTEALVSVRNIQ